MGAAGSTISTDLKGKVIAKNLLDAEILNLLGGSSAVPDQITVEQLTSALKNKTDVFLTHNWGPNQDNHKRVAVINEGLKAKGLLTWFDSEKMEGDVQEKMTDGIDNASCVVVFVTQLYIDKVRGDNAKDNCRLEFGYAARSKTASRMVPVVMESGVHDSSGWKGTVGMNLGGLLYVDMCDVITDAKISELYLRILSVNNGVKLTDLFEKCMTLAMKHATLPSGAIMQQPVATSVSNKGELYDWLTQTVRITPKAAETYCTILTNANIGSVDRLTKRYDKNKNLLAELNIDEFDAEDMVKALVSVAPTSSSTYLESPYLTRWSEKVSWKVESSSRVKVSPDCSVVAVAPDDSTHIQIYDTFGSLRITIEVDKRVICMSFSPDSTKMAASDFGDHVKLFEVSSGNLLWSARLKTADKLCFFNSYTIISSHGYYDESCAVIDVSTGSVNRNNSVRLSDILCVSSRGTIITVDHGKVIIWDNFICSCLKFDCSDVSSMCINSDGSLIYVGTKKGDIRVYSDSGLAIDKVKKAHGSRSVGFLSMNETNSVLASGGGDYKVRLWNASTLEYIQTLECYFDRVITVNFAKSTIMSCSGLEVKIWSATNAKAPKLPKASWDMGGVIQAVKFSPDGSVIAVVPLLNSRVWIYDHLGVPVKNLEESMSASLVSFSPDGTKLAASSYSENCVKLFEVSSGRLLWSTTVKETFQVCFFNISTLVASEGLESCVIIDISSGSITSRISADGYRGLCVSNRDTLITAGDGKVTIWDNLKSSRLCFDRRGVSSMCINSDGSLIYVGTRGGDIRVYSDSGLVIREVKKAHGGSVYSLSMNETNSVLASSGGDDNKVKLWNASTLECIQTLDSHTDNVNSVSFASHKNNFLVSGSSDDKVKVWSFGHSDRT